MGEAATAKARVAMPPADRLELFAAPVLFWRWPEAEARKEEIVEAIRMRQRTDPGIVRTNRNGWHSRTDLPAWPEPAMQALVRWVADRAQAASLEWRQRSEATNFAPWRMDGWANVNPPGGLNLLHHHAQRDWHWSACYYVHLGEIPTADVGGGLVFEEHGTGLDPRGAVDRRSRRVVPREGQLIIFPAWLSHRVEPHSAGGDRISIAFNLHNAALERSRLWEHRPSWKWRMFPAVMRRVAAWRGTRDETPGALPPGVDVDLTRPAG